jgi:hypothetical protein
MVRLNAILGGCLFSLGLLAAISCSSDEGDDGGGTNYTNNTSGGASSGGAAGSSSGAGGSSGDAGSESGTGGSSGAGAAPQMCTSLAGLENCGFQTVGATFKRVNLLLVVDKSGSMDDPIGGVEKWDALKQALGTALPNVQARVNLGLEMFPKKAVPSPCTDIEPCCELPAGSDAINVPVGAGEETVPRILEELDTTTPGGGTPTAGALKNAYDYFTTGAGKDLEGEKYVVLATDGGPNCNPQGSCATDASQCTLNMDGKCSQAPQNCCTTLVPKSQYFCLDDEATNAQLAALTAEGISTFVIGIPGTEQYASYLDQFAVSGGQPNPNAMAGDPKYFAVSQEAGVAGLTQVFVDITTKLVQSCEIQLEMDPPDPNEVNVAVDCEVIPKTSQTGSGWELDGAVSPAKVMLKGPLCNYVETQGVGQIDVVFGCPTIEIR